MCQLKALIIPIFVLFILALPSCQDSLSPGQKAVKKFHDNFILKQYEERGYQCIMTGGGGDGEGYKLSSIGFVTHEKLNISSARRQAIESILEYVNDINQHNEFNDYFVEWPFQTQSLEYHIEVDRGDGLWPVFPDGLNKENEISYASFINNKIRYLLDVNPKQLPQTIHTETLEEAITILKAEGWREPTN